MEYTRKLIPRRLVALKTRSSIPQHPDYDQPDQDSFSDRHSRYVGYRATKGERLRATVARHVPSAESLKERRRRSQDAAMDFARSFRDRSWLVRAGCAGAALLLFAFLIASSHSPASPPTLAGSGNSTAATTSPSQSPTDAASSAVASSAAPAAPSGITPASPSTVHAVTSAPADKSTASTPTSHPSSKPTAPSLTAPTTSKSQTSTSSKSSTTTQPSTATTTTTTPSSATSTSPAVSSVLGCWHAAVRCAGGLIYTVGGPALVWARAIGVTSYHDIAIGTSVPQALETLGAPMSVAALKSFIGGSSFLSPLVQSQPVDDSCAYYPAARARNTRAFQLCFDSAQDLVTKAIISTSGGVSSGS